MSAIPPTFPVSKASFYQNTYTFDPLLAGECISQSALIATAAAIIPRGTVLYGPAMGAPITATTVLTPVSGTGAARCILAADIDTTGGQATGIVYTQGKFLDTAMTFSAAGAASDVAELWPFGVYVLTVEQRSGLLVPMTGLPTTGGPLPQSVEPDPHEEAKEHHHAHDATKEHEAANRVKFASSTTAPPKR
jgi:hypothetical protein